MVQKSSFFWNRMNFICQPITCFCSQLKTFSKNTCVSFCVWPSLITPDLITETASWQALYVSVVICNNNIRIYTHLWCEIDKWNFSGCCRKCSHFVYVFPHYGAFSSGWHEISATPFQPMQSLCSVLMLQTITQFRADKWP